MNTAAPAAHALDLPAALQKRGIDAAMWSALQNSIYPGARDESILMVIDYCRARRLDPLKKPCHIVNHEVRNARTGQFEWRDVVMPGIYEHRTTAQRTGFYMGHSEPQWGPIADYKGLAVPEWCAMTMYRLHPNGEKIPFPVRVFFREVVNLASSGKPNARWLRAPLQMLLKCTEAAGLREAFPDAIGGEQTAEEMDGARAPELEPIDVKALPPKPDTFDEWLLDLRAVADEGEARLREAWKESSAEHRGYLTTVEPATWTAIKTHAADVTTRPAPAGPPLPLQLAEDES